MEVLFEIMLKLVATNIHTPKKEIGLLTLGITAQMKANLFEAASPLSQKQSISFSQVTRNPVYPELADVSLSFQVLGETVENIKLTIFVPDISPQTSEIIASRIDEIEASGMRWAEDRALYKGKELEILENTFCSALVHSAYPVSSGDSSGVAVEVFSPEESALLDKWIRALFANDEERDVFNLVECPGEVEVDNRKMMSRLSSGSLSDLAVAPSPTKRSTTSHDTDIAESDAIHGTALVTESKKLQAMHEVISALVTLVGAVPPYFFTTLHNYFESTVLEAANQFEIRWPSHTQLETVKEDSSVSIHAIAAGAAVKGLAMDQLLENLTLKYIGRYSAKAVESHNDVNSHSKETRQRLKKLLTLLNEIDERYTEFQPFLVEGNKSEDPSLNYLARAYKSIEKIGISVDLKTIPPRNLLLKYLEILPSFNRVDLYVRSGKTLKESYDLVAERGNESILEMTRSIKSHVAAIHAHSLVVPKAFRQDVGEFIRQSQVWIAICEGWGSQNIWEWEARRYNEALPTMGGKSFVEKILWLKSEITPK